MTAPKPRYKIGKYSEMERLDSSELKEPDQDDAEVREIWYEEERNEPKFKEFINKRIEYFDNILGLFDGSRMSDYNIIAIGHSHIDVCWKWRYEQTREKAMVTFNKACEMAEKWYPNGEYTFHQSQAQLFEWIEEDYPELFERIKKQVKAGTFNIVGGCWVEPDCMMPSGEAFIRQRLYGMNYFNEKFGIMPKIGWMMDSFGYGRNLPQIFKKSGAEYFWTTKITWNRSTVFPFVNFWWQSPDGTRILCHESHHGFGTLEKFNLFEIGRHYLLPNGKKIWDYTDNYEDLCDHVEEDEINKNIGLWYGKGDGGHGPTSQEVAEMKEFEAKGALRIGTAQELFNLLKKDSERYPVWNDEFYLEYHRGTFTTHSQVKRNNRRLECKSVSVEMLCSLINTYLKDEFTYPREKIDKSWKKILKNQFHDALPGSSIPEAYDDLFEDWEICDELLDESIDKAMETIMVNEDEIAIFNPNAGGLSKIFIPLECISSASLESNGMPPIAGIKVEGKWYPLQPVEAEPEAWLESKPAGWWAVIPLRGVSLSKMNISLEKNLVEPLFEKYVDVQVDGDLPFIENDILRVELNKQSGTIIKATSNLVSTVNNLFSAPSNVLQAFVDDFPNDQAWNIRNTVKPEYNELPRDYQIEDLQLQVSKIGPVVSEIKITGQFGPQPIIQKIALFKGLPEIYCEFLTDWQEPTTLVKIAFATTTNAAIVESDNQYCTIQRRTAPETPADIARWEKIQHKFSDLHGEEGNWGIAFLNNGKYAFDTLGEKGNFRLTVLKSANYPNAANEAWVHQERKINLEKYGKKQPQHTDMGQHRTFYAIYPHPGITTKDIEGNPSTKVKQQADKFNFPVLIHGKTDGSKIDIAKGESLLKSSNDAVLIKSLKIAEKNEKLLIIRLVEYSGNKSNSLISIDPSLMEWITRVYEVDLLEREIGNQILLDDTNSRFLVTLSSWEIKTIAIELK